MRFVRSNRAKVDSISLKIYSPWTWTSDINKIKRTWNSKKSLHDHCIARHRYKYRSCIQLVCQSFFSKIESKHFFVSVRVYDSSISLGVVRRLYELCSNRFVRSTIKKKSIISEFSFKRENKHDSLKNDSLRFRSIFNGLRFRWTDCSIENPYFERIT